jgi:hypothetical protein
MKFEVLMAVKISIVVFLVVTSCGLVYAFQHFALKMDTIRSSETLVTTQITQRHNPEYHDQSIVCTSSIGIMKCSLYTAVHTSDAKILTLMF